jgi:UDP-GlcNAc:undecaprenyl-phosphate GlcNAc-1-phosphate transferase
MVKLYLAALAVSFAVATGVTPLTRWLARRCGALDPVDPRKIHSVPTPRWGGLAIMLGFFSSIFWVWHEFPAFQKLLKVSHGFVLRKSVIFTLNLGEQFAGILFGALLLLIVGLFDDRKPVRAGMKLLFQIIAAYVAMTYGVRIYGLSIPGYEAYSYFPLWFMQIITILWIVGLSNAVNLVDGLDGLAAGVVAVVAAAFLIVALIQPAVHVSLFQHQMQLAGVLAAAILGAVLGFLIYNFNPASVFMGDGGSLSLGFLLACIAVIGAFKTTVLVVMFVPVILVAVPLTDMIVAFGRRLLKRRNPFSADRGHLHHRLLDAGWTQREVVLTVYVLTLVLALGSITVVAVKRV